MQEESRTIAGHTLAVLHQLVENVKVLMEGEERTRFVVWRHLNTLPLDSKVSTDSGQHGLRTFDL